MKEEKIRAAKSMKEQDELKECTFEPSILQKGDVDTTRDLDTFLEDQKRFLENKQGKIEQRKMEKGDQEIDELTMQPRLDDLSVQIVEMMDDRKGQSTHDRLYKKGYESLREKSLREYEKKVESQNQSRS